MKAILAMLAVAGVAAAATPIPVVFDTDMGNDVDDVMALAMLHALESQGKCRLLAVTVSKDNPLAAPFADAVDSFYGRPDIPVGAVRNGVTKDGGRFLSLANATDGSPRFPHGLKSGDTAPDAVTLLRKVLAAQPDGSVVAIQTGFSTNLARLLDSNADDFSPLSGLELVRKKVRLLALMAGAFAPIDGNAHYREFNIVQDIAAAQNLARNWPTPRIWSGFEIGAAVPYPHESIEKDFEYVNRHPLKEAYYLYQPPPHDRPTWDATAVLAALLPDEKFFYESPEGIVTVEADGGTTFRETEGGPDRYLILQQSDAERVRAKIVELCTAKPPKQ